MASYIDYLMVDNNGHIIEIDTASVIEKGETEYLILLNDSVVVSLSYEETEDLFNDMSK